MSSPSEFTTIASAPIFVVTADVQIPGGLQLKRIAFQELGGINSEVSIEQYISSDIGGYTNHSKQFGLVKPPTVTLKRGLDSSLTLWAWHQMAVAGKASARASQMSLEIFGGGLRSVGDSKPIMSFTEDVVIACDEILLDS